MSIYQMDYKKADIRNFFNENVKSKLTRNLVMIYSVIGAVIFLVFALASVIIKKDFSFASPFPYVFLLIIAVIIWLAVMRSLRNSQENMYKEFMSMYNKDTITCSFASDRLYISNTDFTSSSNGYIFYKDLEKAVESDNYFYCFLKDGSAQIIRKSAITHGSVEDTRNTLRKALRSRYKSIMKLRGR